MMTDEIDKLMTDLREAVKRFQDDPTHRCAGCAKGRDVRINGFGYDTLKKVWMVTMSYQHGELEGWVSVKPMSSLPPVLVGKDFCPDCAKEKGLS